MTPSPRRGSRRPQPVRLWWALPTLAVASAAVVMGVVVGPTVGEHVTIPRQLAVPAASSSTPPPKPPTTRRSGKSRSKPRHTSTAIPTPASSAPEQTHVVAPRRPVVRASSDDSHENDVSSGESEAGDR